MSTRDLIEAWEEAVGQALDPIHSEELSDDDLEVALTPGLEARSGLRAGQTWGPPCSDPCTDGCHSW